MTDVLFSVMICLMCYYPTLLAKGLLLMPDMLRCVKQCKDWHTHIQDWHIHTHIHTYVKKTYAKKTYASTMIYLLILNYRMFTEIKQKISVLSITYDLYQVKQIISVENFIAGKNNWNTANISINP